jgi:hypothetical protein
MDFARLGAVRYVLIVGDRRVVRLHDRIFGTSHELATAAREQHCEKQNG